MKDYLTAKEVIKIEKFCKDKEMYEAVKKVLLQHIYDQGVMKPGEPHNPLKNRALAILSNTDADDEKVGQKIRALWEGINAVETGYNELKTIKSKVEEEVKSPYNIAE